PVWLMTTTDFIYRAAICWADNGLFDACVSLGRGAAPLPEAASTAGASTGESSATAGVGTGSTANAAAGRAANIHTAAIVAPQIKRTNASGMFSSRRAREKWLEGDAAGSPPRVF